MEVNCEGCAGCCLDWRPLLEDGTAIEHERRGPRAPLDDVYNLVPLEREEIRAFLATGYGDALIPRLWAADSPEEGVEIDGHTVAAVGGRPAFFVGFRKPPKPVAPFDGEPAWLPSCVFLDPETLQCRIHGDELYPAECAEYPAHNLALERETECERVEGEFGGERLLDGEPGVSGGLLLGPQAIGGKLFCHPRPEDLEGRVARAAAGDLTTDDRAEFVAVAAASSPGTLAISEPHYERTRERVLEADSWIGAAIREWTDRAARENPEPELGVTVEERRGAPPTPGWDGGEAGSE